MTAPGDANTKYVLPESTALVVIGGLDLLSTVYLIATNRAHEANPLFARLLQSSGVGLFITLKALMLAIPLSVAEFARRHRPEFVRAALRACIVIYLAMFIAAYARLIRV